VISQVFHFTEKELEDYIKSSKRKIYLNNPDLIFTEIKEPLDLQCPISNSLFINPVTAGDGNTYEKEAIEQWIRQRFKPHHLPKDDQQTHHS